MTVPRIFPRPIFRVTSVFVFRAVSIQYTPLFRFDKIPPVGYSVFTKITILFPFVW